MALAKEIMGAGFSDGQARGITGNINEALVADGTTQADATPMLTSAAIVTGANATKGVILSSSAVGRDSQLIVNNALNNLKVYPPVGAAIVAPGSSMGTVNVAYEIGAYGVGVFTRLSATQWAVTKSA